MEALSAAQSDLCERLTKAEVNYKKSPKMRITKGYLYTRIETAEEQWREFRDNHRQIVLRATSEEKDSLEYFTADVYEIVEDIYIRYKTLMKEALEQIYAEERMEERNIGTVPENVSTPEVEAQLPRIQLPMFTGKYEEWPTFYDLFVSTVHNSRKLAAVQKLKFLKSSVSGEPELLLRNYATTENNYEEAWKQLTRRYNNKRYNCNAVMKILFSQKNITVESASLIKQLLDTTNSCLQSLNNLGIETKGWDAIIIYFIVSKLDHESHKQWENQINMISEDLPTWSQFTEFLESRFRSLEMIEASKHAPKGNQSYPKQVTKAKSFHSSGPPVDQNSNEKNKEAICAMCNGPHYLYHCKKFQEQSAHERQDFIQNNNLCFNCFSNTHSVRKCRQSTCCRKCGRRHHTLLHFEKEENQGNPQKENEHSEEQKKRVVGLFSKEEQPIESYNVLLATAVVRARSRNGSTHFLRALLDQGSQASFITENTVQLLGLKRTSVNGSVSGLGGETRIKHLVSLNVESRHKPNKAIHVNAYVMSSIASMLPSSDLCVPAWHELSELPLADPAFHSPGRIDILLGAEVYSEVMLSGIIKNPQENLIAQNTMLGWILSGKVSPVTASAGERVVSMHLKFREDEHLKRFWEIENEPDSIHKSKSESEQKCEQLYEQTTVRDETGRFIVRLPFTTEEPECQYGESRVIAMKRLQFLEKRLSNDPELYAEYRKVMDEYIALNHMALVDEEEIDNPTAVYLPHHPVVREDKETTKVRVVFNASCKGTNNISLNDNLFVGPKIQQDLRHLLMRWRTHRICIIADLVKMYRQVRVSEKDTNYQRVLWRPNTNEPIQHFKLLTLTFGTACAPYLAVKTLQQLAEKEQARFPTAANIAKQDYYIDDLMTGCETEQEASHIYEEMSKLMKSGGFEMQKWSSNNKHLLQHIEKEKHQTNQSVPIKSDTIITKVLGISWNRETDHFEYKVNLPVVKEPITKRQVLSDIARLYDPLGWIAPIVITAKIFIQKLWKSGLGWDEALTNELSTEWVNFREELVQTENILIPRWHQSSGGCTTELHAFSDASRAAYAAAVYLKVVDEHNKVHVSLVSAKTKVAPADKELSIPRLELCGAALAAKLLSEVSQVMDIPKEKLHAWCDSTVVLAWLKGPASRWTTFVSNRVSNILTILDYEQWGHVKTEMNPADCASRGSKPRDLQKHPLWWYGPKWLSEREIQPEKVEVPEVDEELRVQTFTSVELTEEEFPWAKFSNLTKMLKVISYCRRILKYKLPNIEGKKLTRFISTEEMKDTLQQCIKQTQEVTFSEEKRHLKSGKCVQKKSVLHTLCPILDEQGILRVGGRIDQADASYEKRHPIILPAKSHLTKLIIADAHNKTLHGGPQVMLNFLRSNYWILRARNQVKKHFKQCTTCVRFSRIDKNQLMGQIPAVRLWPNKPFKATGVDYAGPINIRFSPGRGAKSYKGYICLFVCMVTRAIHLEAVSDLTAKGYIAAFRRFVARRGRCSDLYSDNGTNFVGADKLLREMFNSAKSEMPNDIAEALTLEATTWHFIPPHAPNFGGLWEAGVRCAKAHLKRVIGNSTLTYEELSTVLTQVEACLNSRPLTVLSDNPDDPLPLTPGHFLIGEPLLNVNDVDYTKQNVYGLNRWKLTQQMVTHFWKRWSKEYLVNLNQRYKWTTKKSEPDVGDVVVIVDDNLPPAKWLLGRIVVKHPGPDNVTRVVTVKNKNGLFKRPISKISMLTK